MFLCLRDSTGAEGRKETFDAQTVFLRACVL